MKKESIGAKAPKVQKTFVGEIELPETAAEGIQVYGDSAVWSNAVANFRITVQSAIRRLLEAGKSDDEVQSTIAQMKMGVSLPRGSGLGKVTPAKAKETILSSWATMSPEERKEFMAALRAAA